MRKRQMRNRSAILVCLALMMAFSGCHSHPSPPPVSPTAAASANLPEVNGQKAIELRRNQSGTGVAPEFLSATLLPGRGMNLFQITAYLPGRGEVPLLASPSLEQAIAVLNGGPDDLHGNKSFSFGGAFLVPFANRIVGPITKDKATGQSFVTATWHGRTIHLLANWHGKMPGAPLHAMHGDLLDKKAASVDVRSDADSASADATYSLPAEGQWFSDNSVKISVALHRDTITATVTVTNTGSQPEPVGVGWHPYFQLPSGSRANGRLHLPADMRAVVNNYDDVFPTGQLVPVAGTEYDFTAADGAPLPNKLVDDMFTGLKRDAQGHAVSEIRDLATNYGLRVTAMTPHIQAIQVYSPVNKSFIALEPQFNYGDPFGKEWHGRDTGMVTVAPGASVTWQVQLQLFQPSTDDMVKAPHLNTP
jgi:aldose 1-epimerase